VDPDERGGQSGPRRAIASAQDERVLNERRRYRDRPFDAQPQPSASLADLDVEGFRRHYLPAAIAPDVLEANDGILEQRLAATKMIANEADPTPTVLGVLVCGRDPLAHLPGAYIQFLRIAGSELGDPIVDEQRIAGTVAEVLRRLDDKLVSDNSVAVDYTSGPIETRRAHYPAVALQQLTRNAVLHRSYESTNAPVRVYWFDDRIEIASPGGPFGEVMVQNFGLPHLADYRNPNLAEALRVLGFVQKFGSGIAIARRALRENGNPELEFRVRPENMLVVVRAKT
jgi:ATP-dependent DNA helicase RecG